MPHSTHYLEIQFTPCYAFVMVVCLSVCRIPHIVFVHSALERGRTLIFFREVSHVITLVNGGVYRSRSRSLRMKVFRTYLCQKWIDLGQTKTKTIIGPFYTYCQMHSLAKMLCFCTMSVIILKGHIRLSVQLAVYQLVRYVLRRTWRTGQ